ncbi:hypothetical protein RB628_05430 [Streptomyces sp. ADMS]|uniref:hypothetical protein n=1 Tax=Streptomyces sp. ADMS TaxID=3071415 RepID=UPI00296F4521|nr:hypothetical protein [Streptomyces sp. ADMS]MDW4904800.1 hypothetical protein [Streptomyces sp. ADMS]
MSGGGGGGGDDGRPSNQRSAAGIERGVTTALPGKGGKAGGVGALLAASTAPARRPN